MLISDKLAIKLGKKVKKIPVLKWIFAFYDKRADKNWERMKSKIRNDAQKKAAKIGGMRNGDVCLALGCFKTREEVVEEIRHLERGEKKPAYDNHIDPSVKFIREGGAIMNRNRSMPLSMFLNEMKRRHENQRGA